MHTVKEEWKDRFVLTAEDYLHGVISVVNELVRHDIHLCAISVSLYIGDGGPLVRRMSPTQ